MQNHVIKIREYDASDRRNKLLHGVFVMGNHDQSFDRRDPRYAKWEAYLFDKPMTFDGSAWKHDMLTADRLCSWVFYILCRKTILMISVAKLVKQNGTREGLNSHVRWQLIEVDISVCFNDAVIIDIDWLVWVDRNQHRSYIGLPGR